MGLIHAQGNGIKTEQEATSLISQIRFSGLTPLGTVSPFPSLPLTSLSGSAFAVLRARS